MITELLPKGMNFKILYVYNSKYFTIDQVNTDKNLQLVFSNPDKNKFMVFRNEIARVVGNNGYAKFEIHPDNVFLAFDNNNQLIKLSE